MRKVIHHTKLEEGQSISIPSSKSLSHRALICAALADGTSTIYHLAENNDTLATMQIMERFGVSFEKEDSHILVHGNGSKLTYDGMVADSGESGSTLRFLIPIAALMDQKVRFEGHGKLMERPQSVYEEIFAKQGLYFEKDGQYLDVRGPLKADYFIVKGDISSQFITGLLLALPLCENDSVIEVLPPFESKSYIDLTMDALHNSGIQIQQDEDRFVIAGNQTYKPFQGTVQGDDSQAAFFAQLAMIQQTTLDVLNIAHDSRQGDHIIFDFIRQMGGEVVEIDGGYRLSGKSLHGIRADLANCPDLGPALFALATQCEGVSTFTSCGRLRIKESDRIACMEEELRKLGCRIESEGDTVTVYGKAELKQNVVLNGHNDHRIVMALSILATLSDNITIEEAEAVRKSYPLFFEDIQKLGIEVS